MPAMTRRAACRGRGMPSPIRSTGTHYTVLPKRSWVEFLATVRESIHSTQRWRDNPQARLHNDMNLLPPGRPLLHLAFLLPSCTLPVHCLSCRHESSARRTTKRLRPKQDRAAIPSRGETRDHIVFNPPSSAPSPYHTPPIFLPPNDPRRRLLAQTHAHANPYQDPQRRLPPPVRPPYEKTYHLNEAQIAEIRQLRAADPFKWTRAKLAEKFGCTEFFVGLVAPATPERMDWSKQLLENTKARWGRRRANAREDRTKRREMWGRDE